MKNMTMMHMMRMKKLWTDETDDNDDNDKLKKYWKKRMMTNIINDAKRWEFCNYEHDSNADHDIHVQIHESNKNEEMM